VPKVLEQDVSADGGRLQRNRLKRFGWIANW
jgi:hypothetical protein